MLLIQVAYNTAQELLISVGGKKEGRKEGRKDGRKEGRKEGMEGGKMERKEGKGRKGREGRKEGKEGRRKIDVGDDLFSLFLCSYIFTYFVSYRGCTQHNAIDAEYRVNEGVNV